MFLLDGMELSFQTVEPTKLVEDVIHDLEVTMFIPLA